MALLAISSAILRVDLLVRAKRLVPARRLRLARIAEQRSQRARSVPSPFQTNHPWNLAALERSCILSGIPGSLRTARAAVSHLDFSNAVRQPSPYESHHVAADRLAPGRFLRAALLDRKRRSRDGNVPGLSLQRHTL